MLVVLTVYLRNNFSLLWIIMNNAWCWRTDCEVLIYDGEATLITVTFPWGLKWENVNIMLEYVF